MTGPSLNLSTIAIALPWIAAILTSAARRQARAIGFLAALLSALASVLLLHEAPVGQTLAPALMVLYSCLGAIAMLVLPRRDCDWTAIAGMLLVLGSTLLAYSTEHLLIFLAAWILTTVPFFLEPLVWRA